MLSKVITQMWNQMHSNSLTPEISKISPKVLSLREFPPDWGGKFKEAIDIMRNCVKNLEVLLLGLVPNPSGSDPNSQAPGFTCFTLWCELCTLRWWQSWPVMVQLFPSLISKQALEGIKLYKIKLIISINCPYIENFPGLFTPLLFILLLMMT